MKIKQRIWYYVELKINWNHKRCKHAIERMWLRGISMDEVKDAIVKGKKVKQKDTGLMETFYWFFSVVYDGQIFKPIFRILKR